MADDAAPDDSELPGTPESRKADGDRVRERTADAVRRLRRSVGEVLKVVRDRFQTLPLRCGSERQRIAVGKLFDATYVLGIVLTNLPRTPKIDGTIGESVLTSDGLSVPQANLEDYISAVSWLREAADELKALTSDKEGLPDVTAIPEKLVRELETAERMLAFADAEEVSSPTTVNPNVSVETTAKERPTCSADLEPTSAAEMLRWKIAKRIAPSLGPLPPSGEHEMAMTCFLKPFNRSPHHRTVWEHYNKLRKIEADDLPRWESEAKSAGLTLQDYIDKLALPHMERFIAFNGIPLPPESSETQTPAVRADDDANETTQSHSARNERPGDSRPPILSGPVPPNKLRWKGADYELESKPFHLLEFMWDRQQSQAGIAADHVWGPNQDWTTKALRNHVSKVNAVLLEANVGWALSFSKGFVSKI